MQTLTKTVEQLNECFLKIHKKSVTHKKTASPLLAQLSAINESVTRKKAITSLIHNLEQPMIWQRRTFTEMPLRLFFSRQRANNFTDLVPTW